MKPRPMNMFRRHLLCLAALAATSSTGFAQTPVLRVTAIPDESPTELARKFAPLGAYLESKLGMKVEWTPVTDYPAAVETLVHRKIDLAWFGGFTFVQAHVRSGGKVVPLVQREEDERFGSASSTSGHLMPRSFLLASKINPDVDLKRVSFSGAHDATIAAVASGKVDAGALNISVWEKFVADKKVDTSQVKVFYTTPAYYDYNWTVHADMPAELREKIKQAFLTLDPNTPQGKEILALQRATRFVPTKAENYQGIRSAAENAGLLK